MDDPASKYQRDFDEIMRETEERAARVEGYSSPKSLHPARSSVPQPRTPPRKPEPADFGLTRADLDLLTFDPKKVRPEDAPGCGCFLTFLGTVAAISWMSNEASEHPAIAVGIGLVVLSAGVYLFRSTPDTNTGGDTAFSRYNRYQAALKEHEAHLIRYQQECLAAEEIRRQRLHRELKPWLELDGHTFEQELANFLRKKFQYGVEVTPPSNDGGIDLILSTDDNRKILVQCKAYAVNVGVEPVRALFGTLIHSGPKYAEAWLVTTSGFSTGAREFAAGKNIRLVTMKELLKGGS